MVVDALFKRHMLISTLNANLLGFEYIKDLYINNRDFVNVFNACEKVVFGKFCKHDILKEYIFLSHIKHDVEMNM